MDIRSTVGRGCRNSQSDVVLVQQLLNDNISSLAPNATLPLNGICDNATIALLEEFQRRVMEMYPPTGRVDLDSPTWHALNGRSGPIVSSESSGSILENALRVMEEEAVAFSQRFIQDAKVRANYVEQAKKLSEEILKDVTEGKITTQVGADKAHAMRNGILDASRLQNSDIGRAISEAEKATGKTLLELMEHYAGKLHGKDFAKLTAAEQDAVFLEIIKASGRPNPKWTSLAAKFGKAGKGVLVVTLAISAYTIWTSDRPGREAAKQGVTVGVGFLGSVAGGAAAGLACGPASPVCVGVGAFVGGMAFALGADFTFDWLWK